MSYAIEGSTGAWEVVVGLEVHAQVISKAKLFMRYKEFMDIARLRGGVDHYNSIANNAVSPKYFSFNVANQAKREFQGLGPVNQMQEFSQER